MNTTSHRSAAFKLRAGIMAAHFALVCACGGSAYASHRYDGLNIGGQAGDATFWDSMLGVGTIATLAMWAVTFVFALGVGLSGRFPTRAENVAWIVASILAQTIYATAWWWAFNYNVHVAY